MYSSHVIVLGDGGVSDCRLTGCSEKHILTVYLSLYSLRILPFKRYNCTSILPRTAIQSIQFVADTSLGFSISCSCSHSLRLGIWPQTVFYIEVGWFNTSVNQLIQVSE